MGCDALKAWRKRKHVEKAVQDISAVLARVQAAQSRREILAMRDEIVKAGAVVGELAGARYLALPE